MPPGRGICADFPSRKAHRIDYSAAIADQVSLQGVPPKSAAAIGELLHHIQVLTQVMKQTSTMADHLLGLDSVSGPGRGFGMDGSIRPDKNNFRDAREPRLLRGRLRNGCTLSSIVCIS